MKIRIFTIPVLGGEGLVEEMNRFLSSKKIIRTREKLVKNGSDGMFWSFTIRYIDDINAVDRERLQQKVDYKSLLSEEEFSRFSIMRVNTFEASDEAL